MVSASVGMVHLVKQSPARGGARPHHVTQLLQLAQPNRIQKSTLDIRTHTRTAFRATYISTIWQLATSIQGFFCFN